MRTFEFHVIKKSEYDWPILKGKTRGKEKDMVSVRYVEEDSRGRYIFSDQVMSLDDWNKAAKLHNKRKGRKWWK